MARISLQSFILVLCYLVITSKGLAQIAIIQVHPVNSQKDTIDLADLRYNEWMIEEEEKEEEKDDNNKRPPPSRYAFRMATSEITSERSAQGAVAFLAKKNDNAVVGSAELSPIEFEDTCIGTTTFPEWLYVTDVVTSSNHRRIGVGTELMSAMEEYAIMSKNVNRLYLHVCKDNVGALGFYTRRGYQIVNDDDNYDSNDDTYHAFDKQKLAENAGTKGQLLLFKTLDGTMTTRKAP